jgi:hypothetical protein
MYFDYLFLASSGSTTVASTAGNFILSTSQPPVSVGSQPSVTSSTASTPGGFTFNLPKSTQSTGGFPSSTGMAMSWWLVVQDAALV